MVFVAHRYVTFQVYSYVLSWPLSSQLLRRNLVFYFSFCCMALRTVLATVKHTHTQGNTAPPSPIHICGQEQDGAGQCFPQAQGGCLWQRTVSCEHWGQNLLRIPNIWQKAQHGVGPPLLVNGEAFKVQAHFVTSISIVLSLPCSLQGD